MYTECRTLTANTQANTLSALCLDGALRAGKAEASRVSKRTGVLGTALKAWNLDESPQKGEELPL